MSAEAWRRTGSNWRRSILRGRRDAFSTSGSICVAGVVLLHHHRCQRKLGDELGRIGAVAFYVAGVKLSAPQARFAWQAWYFQYLHRCPRKLGDELGRIGAVAFDVAGVTLFSTSSFNVQTSNSLTRGVALPIELCFAILVLSFRFALQPP